MRGARFLLAALVALAASGCMRHDPDAAAGRGLFASRIAATSQSSQAYAQQPLRPPSVLQYVPPAPRPAAPRYAEPQYSAGGLYAAAPKSYAAAASYEQPYTLGPGDKLRVVVFGQDGISNTYIVDAGGNVSLPLIGSVPARGITTLQLSQRIAERLKQGYVREPHVTVEVESYRPFFILGEVTTPGQYPYVADMTVETAIAIAGGFCPARLQVDGRTDPQRAGRSEQERGAAELPAAPGRHRAGQGAVVLTGQVSGGPKPVAMQAETAQGGLPPPAQGPPDRDTVKRRSETRAGAAARARHAVGRLLHLHQDRRRHHSAGDADRRAHVDRRRYPASPSSAGVGSACRADAAIWRRFCFRRASTASSPSR